jgi:hypothetical protein
MTSGGAALALACPVGLLVHFVLVCAEIYLTTRFGLDMASQFAEKLQIRIRASL